MSDIKFNVSVKYKELCNMFGEEPKVGGRNKSLQIKKWQKEYKIIKNGMYYTILRELSEEEKKDKNSIHYDNEEHHIRNKEKYKQFNVDESDRHSSGIYKIQLNNTVYIGQTNDFYNRFRHHYYNNYPTRQMLEDGGVFTILQKCDDSEFKNLLEEQYIKYYCYSKDYICINKYFNNEYVKRNNIKYKKINVEYDKWEELKEILNEKGITYYE